MVAEDAGAAGHEAAGGQKPVGDSRRPVGRRNRTLGEPREEPSRPPSIEDTEGSWWSRTGAKRSVTACRDLGYVQDLNPQVFHPLGLSMETTVDPVTGDEHLVIADWREHPEQAVLEHVDRFKTMLIRDEIRQRYASRTGALGHWVQPAD